MDFDFDSEEDLFVYDRDGGRMLAFERSGTDWIYRPEWVEGWPEIQEWCLLRDYDCDGRPIYSHQSKIRSTSTKTTQFPRLTRILNLSQALFLLDTTLELEKICYL